jgi:hypothetical protein
MKSSSRIISFQIAFISEIMNLSLIDSTYEHIIKYLISNLRFVISKITTSYLDMKESFIKSLKFITNFIIVKEFCEIARNVTSSKKWKRDMSKIITETAIYFLILNKRSKVNITMKYSDVTNVISSYHYVTIHDFRISEKNVLFCIKMITLSRRKKIATRMTQSYVIWKYHAHISYYRKCHRYVKNRIIWKKRLMKEALRISKIQWLVSIDTMKKLLSMFTKSSDDCRTLVETENIRWNDEVVESVD